MRQAVRDNTDLAGVIARVEQLETKLSLTERKLRMTTLDLEATERKLAKTEAELQATRMKLEETEAKLANKDFIEKAKPEVVARAKEKLAELTEQLEVVEKHLSKLEN